MTKRFFYTDALAAAWMAKHFGMEFIDMITGRIEPSDIGTALFSRGYIHPDSLHLLEPQIGDLYYNSCNGSYHEVTEKGRPPFMKDGQI